MQFLPTHLHSTPPLGGGTHRNIAMPIGMEKLEWCGYLMVKNFKDTLIRFDRMYEHDGHTDRHTPHDGIRRTCKALRGKNFISLNKGHTLHV